MYRKNVSGEGNERVSIGKHMRRNDLILLACSRNADEAVVSKKRSRTAIVA